jgi:hypothetical protein
MGLASGGICTPIPEIVHTDPKIVHTDPKIVHTDPKIVHTDPRDRADSGRRARGTDAARNRPRGIRPREAGVRFGDGAEFP